MPPGSFFASARLPGFTPLSGITPAGHCRRPTASDTIPPAEDRQMKTKHPIEVNRRGLLLAAGTLAAGANTGAVKAQTATSAPTRTCAADASEIGRRKLGALEVSSIGMGVQNMT